MPPKVACQLHVRIGEEQSSLPFPLCTQLARVGMWCLLLRVITVVALCTIFSLLIVVLIGGGMGIREKWLMLGLFCWSVHFVASIISSIVY